MPTAPAQSGVSLASQQMLPQLPARSAAFVALVRDPARPRHAHWRPLSRGFVAASPFAANACNMPSLAATTIANRDALFVRKVSARIDVVVLRRRDIGKPGY